MFIYFRIVVPVIEASSSAVSVGVEILLQQSPKLVIRHPSSDSPDYWMFLIEPGSKMVFVPGKKRGFEIVSGSRTSWRAVQSHGARIDPWTVRGRS